MTLHPLDALLARALDAVRRAQAKRGRAPELEDVEAALLELLALLHGQAPQRARQAARDAIAFARRRENLLEGRAS